MIVTLPMPPSYMRPRIITQYDNSVITNQHQITMYNVCAHIKKNTNNDNVSQKVINHQAACFCYVRMA